MFDPIDCMCTIINVSHHKVITLKIQPNCTTTYAQYSVLATNRSQIITRLNELNIPTAIHYPIPNTSTASFSSDGYKHPVAEDVTLKIFSIPMYLYLGDNDKKSVKRF